MKIFIGTHENCGIISGLQEGLTESGCTVTTVVKSRDKNFSDKKYSIDLGSTSKINTSVVSSRLVSKVESWVNRRRYKKLFETLPDFDLYVYCWDTLLPDLKDLELLKKNGKKIFFIFIGSEARYAPAFNQQFPDSKVPWSEYYLHEDLNKKLLFIRKVEKYCDAIFSVPDQAGLQIRPFYHTHLPLDVHIIPFHFPDRVIPRIVHAPSNRNLKGTDRILQALENCKSQGLQFDFRLIENQPNSIVRQELLEADMVIDQIHIHGPGMFGLEAMASGCALATKYLKEYPAFQPPVLYIDHTSVLEENIKELITNRELRKKLALAGRQFTEAHNPPRVIASKILLMYADKVPEYDYHPSFYFSFKPTSSQTLNNQVTLLNKEIIEKYHRI